MNDIADIVPFPTSQRLAAVRDAALTLSALPTQDALTWWAFKVATLVKEMGQLGIRQSLIEAEVKAFQEAVFKDFCQLCRRKY